MTTPYSADVTISYTNIDGCSQGYVRHVDRSISLVPVRHTGVVMVKKFILSPASKCKCGWHKGTARNTYINTCKRRSQFATRNSMNTHTSTRATQPNLHHTPHLPFFNGPSMPSMQRRQFIAFESHNLAGREPVFLLVRPPFFFLCLGKVLQSTKGQHISCCCELLLVFVDTATRGGGRWCLAVVVVLLWRGNCRRVACAHQPRRLGFAPAFSSDLDRRENIRRVKQGLAIFTSAPSRPTNSSANRFDRRQRCSFLCADAAVTTNERNKRTNERTNERTATTNGNVKTKHAKEHGDSSRRKVKSVQLNPPTQ